VNDRTKVRIEHALAKHAGRLPAPAVFITASDDLARKQLAPTAGAMGIFFRT